MKYDLNNPRNTERMIVTMSSSLQQSINFSTLVATLAEYQENTVHHGWCA